MELNKRIASLVITAGLITTMSTLVFADPLSDTLKTQQNQMQQSQTSLQNAQNSSKQMENDLESLDSQIEGKMREISDNNNKIYKVQSDIKTSEADLAKAEADLVEEQNFFDARMKAMYVSGNEGYLEILLDSNGITDFFEKLEGVKKVIQLNKTVVSELDKKKEDIATRKKSLDDENAKLLALKADKEKQLASLNATKASQSKLLAQYKAQVKQYGDEVDKSKSLIAETMKKIDQMKKQAQASQSNTPSRGGSSVSAPYSSDAIVLYAYKFLGIEYQWGGTGPRYDCSGFTQAVYAHFGIYIPRTTYDQVNCGSAVSTSNLQPGDLVFFHEGSSGPEHVGMYVGNGCYIHAPKTGDVIKISALCDRDDIVAARRIR